MDTKSTRWKQSWLTELLEASNNILVKWQGYLEWKNTWEPMDNVKNAPKKIQESFSHLGNQRTKQARQKMVAQQSSLQSSPTRQARFSHT